MRSKMAPVPIPNNPDPDPNPGGGTVDCLTAPKGDDGRLLIHVGPTGLDWSPVPYDEVRRIQNGMMIPNQQCSRRLCRMIRVLMGEANPDLI